MLSDCKKRIKNYLSKKKIMRFYKHSKDKEILEIIDYLQDNELTYFNYNWFKNFQSQIEVKYNADNRPYILVDGKRMYFKKCWDEQRIRDYFAFLCAEQFDESPHSYFDNQINRMTPHKVIDGGAAEGLFSLKFVERCDELYIFECDDEWIEALKLTFAPWEQKVFIINKFLTDSDSDATGGGALDRLITKKENIDLIKLDIEGEEVKCLKGAMRLIELNPQVVILTCAYHYQEEESDIREFAISNDLCVSNRQGYMYFLHDKNQCKPYLRRGVLKMEHKSCLSAPDEKKNH